MRKRILFTLLLFATSIFAQLGGQGGFSKKSSNKFSHFYVDSLYAYSGDTLYAQSIAKFVKDVVISEIAYETLRIVGATEPQFRIVHTAGADSATFGVDGNGDLTITPSGGDVSIAGNLDVTSLTTPYAQTITVAKSGGDYTTIQAAIDAITDAATGKRYAILIYPGVYTENVVMEEYVSLIGVGGHVGTDITAASGVTVITPPNASTANIIGLSIENTGNAGVCVAQTAGFVIMRDVYLSWVNSDNGASGTLINYSGGTLSHYGGKWRYNGGGNSAGTVTHTPVNLTGSGNVRFEFLTGDIDIEDIDDDLNVIALDGSWTGAPHFFFNSFHVDALHASYSGAMSFWHNRGISSEEDQIENNHIFMGSAGDGSGYLYNVDSPAGTNVTASLGNHIHVEGFANNYYSSLATGDTLKLISDGANASDNGTGAGITKYLGTTMNGDYYVTEDVYASYIEFNDPPSSYLGRDKTYSDYFAIANDYTNIWLGYAGDPNIWMNYEKDADVIVGAGAGGDTDIIIQEGNTNKTTLNQDGTDFKVQVGVTNGSISLEPNGTGTVDVSTSLVAVGNIAGATYGSDASVSDAELLRLDATSPIQAQIDSKVNIADSTGQAEGSYRSGKAIDDTSAAALALFINKEGTVDFEADQNFIKADPIVTIRDTETDQNLAEAYMIFGESTSGGLLGRHWKVGYDKSDFNFKYDESIKITINGNGNTGFLTILPDKAVEINHPTGQNLRLTYNDADGSATNYVDLLTTSGGDLAITPSGGDVDVDGTLTASTLISDADINLSGNVVDDGVTTYREVVNLADTGELTMPTAVSGWGEVMAGDNQEWAHFRYTAAGVVTLIANSANVTTTDDTDANMNIYDGGSGIVIENQLGGTLNFGVVIHYYTP